MTGTDPRIRPWRALTIALVVLLTLLLGAEGASAEADRLVPVAHPQQSAVQTPGAAPKSPVRPVIDDERGAQDGHDDCQARRSGRASAGAPSPDTGDRTAGACGCPASSPIEPAAAVPLTGRRAVPLSRSGELSVGLGVFRC